MERKSNFCQHLKIEEKCAPFTTSHGPSTKCCDKYMDTQCNRFQKMYKGKTHCGNPSCLNYDIGQEYICPIISPSPGIPTMPLNPWFAAQNCGRNDRCFKYPNQNMGKHELCKK